MAGARAAIRYAKAVLSLATDQNTAEAVNTDMKRIHQAIVESKDLSNMLQNPIVKSSVKKNVLLEVFNDVNVLTNNLVDTLITNKRISILGNIASSYTILYDELQGTQTAQVTTAIPLNEDLRIKVLAKVKELTGKDVAITNTIDESILGGFILRVGDIQYDASIANKLSKLKREFTLN